MKSRSHSSLDIAAHAPLRTAAVIVSLVTVFALTAFAFPAQAQTFSVLHSFSGGGDGGEPSSGLAITSGGTLYGTAIFGGANGYGLVFELKRRGSGWTEVPLYSFTGGTDGSQPYTTPLIAPDGTLYGANYGQEAECCGAVFHLNPSPHVPRTILAPWDANVLHHFMGGNDDGAYPNGDLALDADGNVYGETQGGGSAGQGVIYKLTDSGGGWTSSILYSALGGSDGGYPRGNVVFGPAGVIYGVFLEGGPSGCGAVYQLSPSGSGWTESTIYAFTCGNDGGAPYGGLLRDQAGNLYGTTTFSSGGNGGTVFQLSPSGSGWTFNLLYTFVGSGLPMGTLAMDAAGNLYGTTVHGGLYQYGSAYKLTPPAGGHGQWTYTSLHNFTDGNDGQAPLAGVALDAGGNVYGTAAGGGANGFGVAFEITP